MPQAKDEARADKDKLQHELDVCHNSLDAAMKQCDQLKLEVVEEAARRTRELDETRRAHDGELQLMRQEQLVTCSKQKSLMREVEDEQRELKKALQEVEDGRLNDQKELQCRYEGDPGELSVNAGGRIV